MQKMPLAALFLTWRSLQLSVTLPPFSGPLPLVDFPYTHGFVNKHDENNFPNFPTTSVPSVSCWDPDGYMNKRFYLYILCLFDMLSCWHIGVHYNNLHAFGLKT